MTPRLRRRSRSAPGGRAPAEPGAHDIVALFAERVADYRAVVERVPESGPSATSDIELIRAEGVHGPRNLHVLLTAP